MPIGSTIISGEFLKIQNFHFGIFCCFFMADEEVDCSRTGQDDEEKTRSISSERNHKNYVYDEVEIENETEKSGEARKHDSKDRKKEKREEKDYNSKVKDKSRQREKWDISGRDKKHDSRERMGSRERRMEDQEDYSKELDSVKEKVRDNGWEERDKGMEWDKDKVMDRTRERSIDGKRDHHRDHVKNKGRESEKQKEVERDRGFHREHGHGKERDKVHRRHTDRDKDKKDRDNGYDKSKVTDRDQYKETDKELERDSLREKDRERGKDRAKEKDKDRFRPKDREKEKLKDREMEMVSDRLGERDKFEKDKGKKKHREKEPDVTTDQGSRGRDGDGDISRGKEVKVEENILGNNIVEIHKSDDAKAVGSLSSSELVGRLKRMKENRRKGNSEAVSEVLSWVDRSRKLEENRNVEKEKTIALSRMLDEQDKILEESEDEESSKDNGKDLAGVKVLHGLDKVMEGGAVVLTLKDQSILADGDINEEVDMLENVEIGEQKRRDEAYRAAKKTGIYDDKFSEDLSSRKTILSQYDDPVDDDGVTLDESGRFTGEAEKKLAELRKRMEGSSLKDYEDLSSSGKVQSDYFTTDEMLQFKKPKKKKSLRKKERLDLDALEAEAKAAGLGDLGSRGDMKRLSAREEEEKSMAKARSSAYQEALAKAEEASKVLRQGQSLTSKPADSDILVFGEDYEDLHRSLEQARRLSLKKKDEAVSSGPQAVALLATAHKEKDDSQSSASGETQENKVVITEMEEFVLGLQINEETSNPETEYVFKEDEDVPMSIDPESNAQAASLTEAKETEIGELPSTASEDVSPDGIIHEIAVGKGLAGALNLLKGRGTLKESIDWGGRNMDKRKSKLVGLYESDGSKEIRIERTDEFGRIMTPKEAFRILSHKFHGKGPGMMKQEKRMKQYQEDLKAKQMKASDTPLLAMEKMRDAQARLKTPYLVLSGHVKPGQTSDPRSGFATVEKDNLGSLTPMLGDKKVEHFLGIRSKPESGNMGPPPPKKPKT